MNGKTRCEDCVNYVYDDDCECYVCEVSLDEDEMSRFMTGSVYRCSYFRLNDEYSIVRKQN